MTFNSKTSSAYLASQAAATLKDLSSSEIARKLAGSVLSQRQGSHQTGKVMEATASRVLSSEKYSEQTKAFAASLVSQSNKVR
jgi:hypothetical protein